MASSFLAPALALLASLAAAEDARIKSEDSLPDWVPDVALGMTLSTAGGDDYPYQYFVVPLTTTAEDDHAASPSVCFHVPGESAAQGTKMAMLSSSAALRRPV